MGPGLDISELVREQNRLTYDERERAQGRALFEITTMAKSSMLFSDRISPIDTVNDLTSLPLTDYPTFETCIARNGLGSTLLQKPHRFYHTSGSTGSSKRMYYSERDVERIARDYCIFTHMIGMRTSHIGWNFGGSEPLVSGNTLDDVARMIPLERTVSTFLGDDSDLVKALRVASREDRIDVMAGAAIVYFLFARAIKDPGYIDGIVRKRLNEDYHLPKAISALFARIFLARVNFEKLGRMAKEVRIGISYAETLSPYMNEIRASFPSIRMHDVLGSTENPLIAAQLSPGSEGLSVFLGSIIPEIADPKDVQAGRSDPSLAVKGIPWTRWQKGMRGELIITRPGDCMPLVRYPTGDIIEVVSPSDENEVRAGEGTGTIVLPSIKVLGRSVDVLDFEVQDESGNFLGNKIYSRHITEALSQAGNVRWWELYNIKGSPGRLVFIIIPKGEVDDPRSFERNILKHLLRECDDLLHTLKVGNDLGRVEVKVTRPNAYSIIQKDIDNRIKEGRSLGQMKPKHIITVPSEEHFDRAVADRMASK